MQGSTTTLPPVAALDMAEQLDQVADSVVMVEDPGADGEVMITAERPTAIACGTVDMVSPVSPLPLVTGPRTV